MQLCAMHANYVNGQYSNSAAKTTATDVCGSSLPDMQHAECMNVNHQGISDFAAYSKFPYDNWER